MNKPKDWRGEKGKYYDYGYNDAIKEFEDWLINDLGACLICDTHDKAIKDKIKELQELKIKVKQ